MTGKSQIIGRMPGDLDLDIEAAASTSCPSVRQKGKIQIQNPKYLEINLNDKVIHKKFDRNNSRIG